MRVRRRRCPRVDRPPSCLSLHACAFTAEDEPLLALSPVDLQARLAGFRCRQQNSVQRRSSTSAAGRGFAHCPVSGVFARRVGVGDPLLGAADALSRLTSPQGIATIDILSRRPLDDDTD